MRERVLCEWSHFLSPDTAPVLCYHLHEVPGTAEQARSRSRTRCQEKAIVGQGDLLCFMLGKHPVRRWINGYSMVIEE